MAKLGPGARIGDQFQLIRKIGEGGCGEVYLAEQTSLGRNAVVKLMHPELSRDPSYVARFRREAQLAARLTHHHTAAIYAFGETPERVLWIAMEYIEGESLHSVLAKEPPKALAELLSPIADVLDRAGALGIIHRDVKPDNILVSPEGFGGHRAVLLDFGLARPAEDNDKLTAVGVAVGSPTYMSPEQVFGPSVDSATDRYAFGIILYIAVAKRPPFRHDDRVQLVLMHKRQPVPSLSTILPALPPGHALDQFFTKALAKQPQDRHLSARQMIQEFTAALAESPLGKPASTPRPPPRTSSSGPRPPGTPPSAPPPTPRAASPGLRPGPRPPVSGPLRPSRDAPAGDGPPDVAPPSAAENRSAAPPPEEAVAEKAPAPGKAPLGKGQPPAAVAAPIRRPLSGPDPADARPKAAPGPRAPLPSRLPPLRGPSTLAPGPRLDPLRSTLPQSPPLPSPAPIAVPEPAVVPTAAVQQPKEEAAPEVALEPLSSDSEEPGTDPTQQAVLPEVIHSAEAELEEEEEEEEAELPPQPGHGRLLARTDAQGLDILCGGELLFGKHRDCELVCRAFPTPEQDSITHGVSRQHARLRVASGKLLMEDLGSLNGTFLDDKRVSGGPVPLYDEARIRLGPVLTIEVRLFKSGAALLRRVDSYHNGGPPTLLLWDKLALGEPLLGIVPPTGDSVTRWGVMQCSRPEGELFWGGPKSVSWKRGKGSPSRPQALQPGDVLSLGDLTVGWQGGQNPGI